MYLIIDLNWFQWKSQKDWFFKDKIDFILSKLQNSAPDLSSEWHFPVQLIVDKLITFGPGMLFYVWVQRLAWLRLNNIWFAYLESARKKLTS